MMLKINNQSFQTPTKFIFRFSSATTATSSDRRPTTNIQTHKIQVSDQTTPTSRYVMYVHAHLNALLITYNLLPAALIPTHHLFAGQLRVKAGQTYGEGLES